VKEDEWICDQCEQVNKIDVDDHYTSVCIRCKVRNLIIDEMVKWSKSSLYK
jgi:hypothetical protein